MNKTMVLIFGTIEIMFGDTDIMNTGNELSFMVFALPVCFSTFVLNLTVIVMIWKKEKTIVNQLLTIECTVSILYSFLGTFQQSPFYTGLGHELYCYPHLLLVTLLLVCNRLLPVAIVVFRLERYLGYF